jgi:hypothetical protein
MRSDKTNSSPNKAKTSRSLLKKRILQKRTEFENLLEKRMRTELHLRTLTQQLRNPNEWLWHLSQIRPGIQAVDVIQRLQTRRTELIKQASALSKQEREQFGLDPDRFRFEPTREDIEKMKQQMYVLQRLLEARPRDVRLVADGEPEEPSCSLWSGVLWSYEGTEYPHLWWSEDDDATYDKEWHFDPYYDIHRGILHGRFSVDNPAPFNIPIIEEKHDWSQLVVTLALAFDVPAPDCDAQVLYQAEMVLGISPNYNARDYIHYVSAILCEQPDASTGHPSSLSDFERIGNAIWNDPDSSTQQTEPVSVSRSFSVRAGIRSRIHLGFTWNLSVASGIAGTASGCWDNFVIFPPMGEDTWGVKVTMVPV